MTYKIGVSGHRKIENPDETRNKIRAFLEKEKNNYPTGIIGISALAEGADTIFAEEILSLDLPLEVVLPFSSDEYVKDFDGEAKENFLTLLKKVQNPPTITNKIPDTKDERRQGYLDCGISIADKSDLMLLVYNGLPSNGKGGTGDIFQYCQKNNKNFFILPTYKNAAQREEIEEIKEAQSTIERLKIERSSLAGKLKNQHIKNWLWTLGLGLLAAVLFAINLAWKIPQPFAFFLNCLEVICFVAGVFLFNRLERGKLKKDRISARRDAELLRTTEKFVNAGIKVQPLENMELNPKYHSDEVEVEIAKFYSNDFYIMDFSNEQKEVLINLINEQKETYHTHRNEKDKKLAESLHYYKKLFIKCFVISVIAHFILSIILFINYVTPENHNLHEIVHFIESLNIHQIIVLLILILPPILGALEAYIYFHDLNKNPKDSLYMNEYFDKRLAELNKKELSKEEFLSIAKKVREKMDQENLDWCISTESNAVGKI